MEALAAVGINSFKFFMAYKGVFQVQLLLPTCLVTLVCLRLLAVTCVGGDF
jgi:hypothetical protein